MRNLSHFEDSTTVQEASQDDIDALKSFIDDNEDLERLETVLDRFNIFESLSLVRQEIRHSAFLRWLLDPTETHGLGDYWVRQFLRKVLKTYEGIQDNVPSLFDLDSWDLTQAEIRKEWHRIDILIRDDINKFICVIENKVDSGESEGQLKRYREIVEQEFEGYSRVYVFLTISGDSPSDDAYISISYEELADIIQNALRRRENQLNDEIKLFVQHYLDMVRRHIVRNSELQELCRGLYRNHRRALDLIFGNRPDRAAEVAEVIQDYVHSREDLIPYSFGKSYIKFLPGSMDVLPRQGTESESKLLLAYVLDNTGKTVKFKLELQPGPQEVRRQAYERVKGVKGIRKTKKLSQKYHSIFPSETWISEDEYNEMDDDEIKERIRERAQSFMDNNGRAVANVLRELT